MKSYFRSFSPDDTAIPDLQTDDPKKIRSHKQPTTSSSAPFPVSYTHLVDFSHNPGLTEVSGYQCPKITSLDFSNNPALVHLNCFDCKLTSLDFSHCKALETVNCFTNELTSIDVTQCKALTSLACQNNRLTSLDVSNNTALIDLMCYANRMTELDASTMSSPDDYSLGCGVQTSDGTTPQTLTLTLRDEQKPHWQYFMVPYEEMRCV